MKKHIKVSLKQLKQELSSVAAEAASGTTVEVTRYNKPFLKLLRADDAGVFKGKLVGSFVLKPLSSITKRNSREIKGSIVKTLIEDRA